MTITTITITIIIIIVIIIIVIQITVTITITDRTVTRSSNNTNNDNNFYALDLRVVAPRSQKRELLVWELGVLALPSRCFFEKPKTPSVENDRIISLALTLLRKQPSS